MAPKKLQRGNWLITAPLVCVALAYLLLVFLPGHNSTTETRTQIQEQEQYISQAQMTVAALQAAQSELSKAIEYTTQWEKDAPTSDSLAQLYGKINELAKATGVTPTRFDPEPVLQRALIREIPISMACTGTFSQIYSFLSRLESLPETTWVTSVVFEKIDQKSQRIACELKLVVFAGNSENSGYAKDTD